MTSLPVGQLFVFGFDEPHITPEVSDLLQKHLAGGVILFGRNITSLQQVVELNTHVIEHSKIPPIISVDQEGGRVARLRDICTKVPTMRVISDLANQHPDLPYKLSAMMAREMVSMGFNLDFAPVLDVDTNPDSPVIGDRSFSREAQRVADLGSTFIRGMQDAGMAACGKHFPGHGDTNIDSHLDLPVVHHTMSRLDNVELLPFQSAIAANVATMMTAHVLMPSIDPNYPATLSPIILQNLLRKKLGYQGLIISDDLEMKAVEDRYEIKEMVRLGLLAGIDLFLICKTISKVHEAIGAVHELLAAGEVPLERVNEALSRIATMKKRYLGKIEVPELAEAQKMVRCAPHLALAQLWNNHD